MSEVVSVATKTGIVRKIGPKKWCLYSRKKNPKTGKRRNLGCYQSLNGVKKRERQVQYFKRAEAHLHSQIFARMPATSVITYTQSLCGLIADSKDATTVLDSLQNVHEVLIAASKDEVRKWLGMRPIDAKKLSNIQLYNILAAIIPDIEDLSQQLKDLKYILSLVKDNAIVPLAKKYDTKVLQLRQLLVAVVASPSVNYAEVVKALEKKHPSLRAEIARIKKQKMRIGARLVQTTIKEMEAGNAKKFPRDKPTKLAESIIKTAGLIDTLRLLADRLQGGIAGAWESIKDEVSEAVDSLIDYVSGSISTISSMCYSLEAML